MGNESSSSVGGSKNADQHDSSNTLPPPPITKDADQHHIVPIIPSSSISRESESDEKKVVISHNSLITGRTEPISPTFKSGWHIHLRPTWNTSFGTAVGILRATANRLPRDIATIRFVTDTSIPTWLQG